MATSINYPDNVLPGPLVANPSHSETQRLLRTTMDSGYIVVRKRFTKVPTNFNVQILLDQSSLSFFQSWFAGDLDYGLNWFNMNLPVGESLQSSHECRFLENPKYTLEGQYWRVSAKIEAIELNLGVNYDEVMEGVISTLGGIRGFDIASSYLDKFDVSLNQTFPASGYGPAA
jgi:hypothetical protein